MFILNNPQWIGNMADWKTASCSSSQGITWEIFHRRFLCDIEGTITLHKKSAVWCQPFNFVIVYTWTLKYIRFFFFGSHEQQFFIQEGVISSLPVCVCVCVLFTILASCFCYIIIGDTLFAFKVGTVLLWIILCYGGILISTNYYLYHYDRQPLLKMVLFGMISIIGLVKIPVRFVFKF